MNQRIKQLAEQAGGIQHDEDGNELTPILVGKDLEKFAQLIVRECAMFVVTELEGKVGSRIADATANRLEEHFGVTE